MFRTDRENSRLYKKAEKAEKREEKAKGRLQGVMTILVGMGLVNSRKSLNRLLKFEDSDLPKDLLHDVDELLNFEESDFRKKLRLRKEIVTRTAKAATNKRNVGSTAGLVASGAVLKAAAEKLAKGKKKLGKAGLAASAAIAAGSVIAGAGGKDNQTNKQQILNKKLELKKMKESKGKSKDKTEGEKPEEFSAYSKDSKRDKRKKKLRKLIAEHGQSESTFSEGQ